MTVGIIPAAGKATRLHGLPKYLLPVPGGYLLQQMADRMGVQCFIGANADNYDLIDAYKRPGDVAYLVASRSMPETILAVEKYTGTDNVLVGMPDTYWSDRSVYGAMARRLDEGAVCTVAMFAVSAEQAARLGMCEVNYWCCLPGDWSQVMRIDDKNPASKLKFAWGALGWQPEFWQYIKPEDAHMGIALQRAIDDGVEVQGYLARGQYYDCGIPEDYFRRIRELTGQEVSVEVR